MAVISNVIAENAKRWVIMKFVTSRVPEFDAVSKNLIDNKDQYEAISTEIMKQKNVQVPWSVIGVVDQREHESNLGLCNSYLGNGQRLNQRTTIVPIGRGPFLSHPTDPPLQGAFFRGALDALIDVQHVDQWVAAHGESQASWLTFLESLNGFGYANKGMASPYIWGGTDQQVPGKYVADHVFDPTVMDTQLGCAGMLRYMSGLDASAGFASPVPVPLPDPTPVPDVTPTVAITTTGKVTITLNGKQITE
jgi:lysozyme family protein